MKPNEELSQTPIVSSPGGSVTWGRRPSGSTLPLAPRSVTPAQRRPCMTFVPPALPPAVPATWAGVARRISITAGSGLVVPSN